MNNKVIAILCMLFSVSVHAQQGKDDILGVWQNPSAEARIQIVKKADSYFGKIIWLKEPNKDGKPKTDTKNPAASLTSQPILGLEILKDFKYQGNSLWSDGTIYDPKIGKTYSCKMNLEGNRLAIRGYIGISLLGRTETWTRVK